jgi:hypothetical protein
MPDDPRVQQLLEELIESGATPEYVCRTCPEFLPEVRARYRQMCRVRAELTALFPTGVVLEPSTPPIRENGVLPRIPGYEVEAVLGQGGVGVVFRARDLRLGRPVALKMLLAGSYAGPTELARFQREAEAVASLCHPNIVQIYEVGDHEGRPYFTMELLDGGSLAQKLKTTPPPVRWAAELVASLADAVAVAHSAGIVHRDLKPANILLTPDGTPKISDFGLARRVEGEDRLTWTGTAVGTPSYMAPEQASGTTDRVGPATDVYGLGAVLYELLTGRPPFRGGSALETFQQVLSEEPVPPSRLNPRVPRDLETVCLKCLQKDPQRRYPGAAALAEDLRRYLLGQVVAARPVGTWERAGKWVRRNPAVTVLSAAAVLALVGGTVASLLFAFEARRQADIATDRADKLADQADELGWQASELKRQAGELKTQTWVAEENAKRAREKEAEVTRALLSGLLIPLGRNQTQLTSPFDATEAEVLRNLRAAPISIRLQFLEAALRDPDAANRVGRRADWIMHAIVGCDRALRAEVEQRIVRRIQEPGAPQEVVLACARLGLSVNIKDRAWAERSAAAVVVALRDPATGRDDYPHLAETLAAVSEHLSPARAAGHAAQVIDVFLPTLRDLDKLSQVYNQLGQAVVVISPWLDADTAARATAALGARMRLPASHTVIWESLTRALVAVCRRLPAPDATAHVHRTADYILEICGAPPEKKIPYQSCARALLPLCGGLDAARAARVADVILAILGESEILGPIKTEFIARGGFAEVLTAVAERLDAPSNLRAAEELVRVLQKSESTLLPFEQLRVALATVCRRLDAAGAARVAEAVVAAVRDPKTSTAARTIYAGVLATVGSQLDPARAEALERALVDSLIADLADVKSLYSRGNARQTVAAVTAVCGHAGAKSAALAADALTETIRKQQTPIELLPPLVKALAAAGARLPPEEASARVNRAIAALASLWGTRTKLLDRAVLAEALAAAWARVGPTEAGAHARRVVADLEDLLRDPKLTPVELSRLAQSLVVVYGHLGPAERAAHANTLFAAHANTFLAALRNPKNTLHLVTVCEFAESLLALCAHLDRTEAVRVFDTLLTALSDLETRQIRIDLYAKVIQKSFLLLDKAEAGQILEHPLVVGRLQRIVLDALGEAKHCSFRSTWDYLDRTATHENATGVPSARPND